MWKLKTEHLLLLFVAPAPIIKLVYCFTDRKASQSLKQLLQPATNKQWKASFIWLAERTPSGHSGIYFGHKCLQLAPLQEPPLRVTCSLVELGFIQHHPDRFTPIYHLEISSLHKVFCHSAWTCSEQQHNICTASSQVIWELSPHKKHPSESCSV